MSHGLPSALPLQATATYAQGGISKGAAYFTPQEPTASPLAVSPGLKKRQAGRGRAAVP